MIDEKAIRNFTRQPRGGDAVVFSLGSGISVVAEEWIDSEGDTHIRPLFGDRASHGKWYDLPEDELAAYCELLEEEIRRRKKS